MYDIDRYIRVCERRQFVLMRIGEIGPKPSAGANLERLIKYERERDVLDKFANKFEKGYMQHED